MIPTLTLGLHSTTLFSRIALASLGRRIANDGTSRITWFALPTSRKLRTEREARQQVTLGVEDDRVERKQVVGGKEKV